MYKRQIPSKRLLPTICSGLNPFFNSFIIHANWGDEGKGKITDVKAAESDIVVRFQGGSNAGHTIINKMCIRDRSTPYARKWHDI